MTLATENKGKEEGSPNCDGGAAFASKERSRAMAVTR